MTEFISARIVVPAFSSADVDIRWTVYGEPAQAAATIQYATRIYSAISELSGRSSRHGVCDEWRRSGFVH